MTTFFWSLEYAKVFFAYLGIMFVWPLVVFRRQLKGKSLTFLFSFCVTVQPVLVNTVVLILGLFHILNPWVIRILFFGTFLLSIVWGIHLDKSQKKVLKRLAEGTYGKKIFWRRQLGGIRNRFGEFLQQLSAQLKQYRLEFVGMLVLIVYAMIYFSCGAFQTFSYGCGDLYPHHQWIYGLMQGQIFSAGVYPEGMHCFVYTMHTLFGVQVYSILLFLAGIHISVFLLTAYILLREIFAWRYTPLLVLTVFLTIDSVKINVISNIARLQWTIPQEFALYTQFLCGAFLLRFLRSEEKKTEIETEKKKRIFQILFGYLKDENIFIFAMALAASIAIHFYPTIMAFFLCVAVVVPFVKKVFQLPEFLALLRAVVFGVVIAVLPMGMALASGIPFQGSIGWAVGIMKEKGTTDKNTQGSTTGNTTGNTQTGSGTQGTGDGSGAGAAGEGTIGEGTGSNTGTQPETVVIQQPEKKEKTSVVGRVKKKLQIVYQNAYVELYAKGRANMLLFFTVLAVLTWILSKFVKRFVQSVSYYTGKSGEEEEKTLVQRDFHGYLIIALTTVIFMMVYCMRLLGLPALIEGGRLSSVLQLYMSAMCLVPFDFIFVMFEAKMHPLLEKGLAIIGMGGIYIVMVASGCFHGYLFYGLTRYNSAVMVTDAIVKTMPEESYTIVSTVDDLYQIIGKGYHEELVRFVNQCMENGYRLPTEYVFLYVEKKPILRSQHHFFDGPGWLAEDKYAVKYGKYSVGKEIIQSELDLEIEMKKYYRLPENTKMYADLKTRTELESRLYAWCQAFSKRYPNELHTYYEDDEFVCYYFKQNPYRPYQLSIQ